MREKGKEEKNEFVRSVAEKKYEFGFTTEVHTEIIEKGLNEEVVRSFQTRKANPAGYYNSVWKPTVIGSHRFSPHGGTCIFQRLTTKPSLLC